MKIYTSLQKELFTCQFEGKGGCLSPSQILPPYSWLDVRLSKREKSGETRQTMPSTAGNRRVQFVPFRSSVSGGEILPMPSHGPSTINPGHLKIELIHRPAVQHYPNLAGTSQMPGSTEEGGGGSSAVLLCDKSKGPSPGEHSYLNT